MVVIQKKAKYSIGFCQNPKNIVQKFITFEYLFLRNFWQFGFFQQFLVCTIVHWISGSETWHKSFFQSNASSKLKNRMTQYQKVDMFRAVGHIQYAYGSFKDIPFRMGFTFNGKRVKSYNIYIAQGGFKAYRVWFSFVSHDVELNTFEEHEWKQSIRSQQIREK